MKYRRALLVAELGVDALPHVALLKRVAPQLDRLLVVVELPRPILTWIFGDRAPDLDARANAQLADLRVAIADTAHAVDLRLVPDLGGDALVALCAAEQIDLLVFGSRSLGNAWVVSAERHRQHAAVLFCDGAPSSGPIREIVCIALDDHARREIGAFLRDQVDSSTHVTFLSPTSLAPDTVAAALHVSGIDVCLDVSSWQDAPSAQEWLTDWLRTRPLDLLVCASISTAFLVASFRSTPVLLVSPLATVRPFGEATIDVPDLLFDCGPMRARVDDVSPVGTLAPVPDQEIAVVAGGRVVATVTTREGEFTISTDSDVRFLGIYRVGPRALEDPLSAIEQQIALITRGAASLILIDAEIDDRALLTVAQLATDSPAEVVAVRMRSTRSFRAIRERLRAAGLPPRVLDARLVLDEGEALDVSEALDPVRLARVAGKLRRAHFNVASIVYRGDIEPLTDGFATVNVRDIEASRSPDTTSRPRAPLDAGPTPGNRIELELDNETARCWLLQTIAGSQRTLHLQSYLVEDDDIGRAVERALTGAGARGVTVRVLVDSLHGLHGSFGVRNSLCDHLACLAGVELRALRPITTMPSLAELKQRDHRKLVVADGTTALLGGRNLAHEYYTAFREAPITPESEWREVPWLDAGARVRGPVVGALEASFRSAWVDAGGSPFNVVEPPPEGSSSARAIVHHGLRDARTLEVYLELIDTAKSHILAISGFPLLLELQHALVRALRRGIRVRTLVGRATPMHGEQPFGGPWAAARAAATELVHSRLDPLIEAGGETYVFAQPPLPGWAPELGLVHPNVHAKVMSVDGLRCSVGSANMDVTASYWESELLLVVEDDRLVGAFEGQIHVLMAGSTLVRRDDPNWKRLAERRAWMRHWPGVLSL